MSSNPHGLSAVSAGNWRQTLALLPLFLKNMLRSLIFFFVTEAESIPRYPCLNFSLLQSVVFESLGLSFQACHLSWAWWEGGSIGRKSLILLKVAVDSIC